MSAASLASELSRVVPRERISADPSDLYVYAYDGTWLTGRPDVVVSPVSAAEVAAVLEVADRLEVPVVPRGAGSGLAGGAVPQHGGIVLSLSRMNRLPHVEVHDRVVVAEPGVVTAHLQAEVERHGLFYPPDPASLKQSTIGGNVATCAGGPRCLKYGVTRNYVVGLEVALMGGRIVRLGDAREDRAAADLPLDLFVGSEGTLGVVTAVTLRLIPLPPVRRTVMGVFQRLADATSAVTAALHRGVVPATVELMDNTTIRVVEDYLHIGLPVAAGAVLLVDVDGVGEEVADQAAVVAESFRQSGAERVVLARDRQEGESLWRARRAVSGALGRLRPNRLGEDIAVPRTAIPEAVARIEAIARRFDLLIAMFGHAGDGNLHPNILCDLRDRKEMERVLQAADAIFDVALSLGGTISGEHGVGMLKRGYIARAVSGPALELMRQIKALLDPKGLLNPGKVLP
ncbi:MAG TPA: FAD-linked oxidase C-terminal domain-containing protein [Chloroflexota bacterium]